ncbi:MAG: DUF5312 family protein [Treponemataceae bacterium]
MAFFDAFSDFFTLLFAKDPVAARTKRELREICNFLKSVKPAIFKVSGNMVLPGFASSLYGVVAAIRPVKELLERTCLSSDQRIARRFRDLLIERRLGPGSLKLLESCAFESMKARSGNDQKLVDSVTTAASEDYRVFLKGFDSAAEQVEAELAEFERLADLCRYDFSCMLVHFDPSVKLESTSYKPKFAAVSGSLVVDEIADLYSVVSIPAFPPSVLDDLVAIAERLGGSDGTDAKRRFSKSLTMVSRALSANVSPAILTALLRAVREEPRYVPPEAEESSSQLKDYKEKIEKRFREDRDRLLRESREQALGSELAALFGPTDGKTDTQAVTLLSVSGYDPALDARLKAEVSRSFAWMTPLSILKTFDQKYLSQGFIDTARRLAVEGFFNNGALRSRLTDSITRLEKCGVRIAAFEDAADAPGRSGSVALRKFLDEGVAGKDVSDQVDRIVKNMDDRAKDLVERDVVACRSLAEAVFEVIGDFRKPTPELVSNIKTLAASKSKDMIPTLANGYNAVARFLKIMKVYILVTPIE